MLRCQIPNRRKIRASLLSSFVRKVSEPDSAKSFLLHASRLGGLGKLWHRMANFVMLVSRCLLMMAMEYKIRS